MVRCRRVRLWPRFRTHSAAKELKLRHIAVLVVSFCTRTSMLSRVMWGLAAVAAGWAMIVVSPAAAEPRIAVVIGNAAYSKGPLKTALGDGGLVAEALNSAGFE